LKTALASVMVSRRCNMSCGHCSVESHPKIKLEPTEEELHILVAGLVNAGVKEIQFTGGEPMLRETLVLELMSKAREHGVGSTMVSNGFWGKKKEKARSALAALRQAGLVRLALSYDRYHSEFQGPEPIMNILDEVQRIGWNAHINVTRTGDERDLEDLVRPFEGHPAAHLRFYDIQPVGMARKLTEPMRGQVDGFCSSCDQIAFTDNGRVIACNGPSYFEPSHSALVLGRYSCNDDLESMVLAHAQDPILETIRVLGPAVLQQELLQIPGFESYPVKANYRGMCEICREITSDPKAVEALRERLSQPERRAALLGQKLVRDGARKAGYHRHEVNYRLAPMAFLRVLFKIQCPEDRKVFGRADLDWTYQTDRLKRAGLLGLFAGKGCRRPLESWAPEFFWERVNREAHGELENPGLESLLEDWYGRGGLGGLRPLYFIGHHKLYQQSVARLELQPFWMAVRDFFGQTFHLYHTEPGRGLARARVQVLSYLTHRERQSELNPWLWIIFPLLYAPPGSLAQSGLESLTRLSRAGLMVSLKALPEAWREASRRLGRKRKS
jgi:Radical SAM superfamily/4Fe-4S single cluster domain